MIDPDLEQFAEDLSAYLDDELSPEQRRVVESKLLASPEARKLLEDLQATSQIITALPRHPAPPTVIQDLNSHLERTELLAGFDEAETTVVTNRPGWFPRLSLAAMITIVAFGGWWMMTTPASSPTKPRKNQFALAEKKNPTKDPKNSSDRVFQNTTKSTLASKNPKAKRETIDTASVETKLAAGVTPRALRAHAFVNEPIRLEIPVRFEHEQAALLKKLSSKLTATSAKDLATGDPTNELVTGAFFYRGRPGVNFGNGSKSQILVRVTRSQLDKVLQEVQNSRHASSMSLKAGALTLKGTSKVSNTLTMLASPDGINEASDSGRTDAQEKILDDVLVSLGVDPSAFRQPATPAIAPADALTLADDSKEESPFIPPTPGNKVATARKYRRSRSTARNQPPQETTGEVATANAPMTVTPQTRKKSRETYLTFIIEIPITKPANKPGNKKKTPSNRNSNKSK